MIIRKNLSQIYAQKLLDAINTIRKIFNGYKISLVFNNIEHSKPLKNYNFLKEQQKPGKITIEIEFPVTDENVDMFFDINIFNKNLEKSL